MVKSPFQAAECPDIFDSMTGPEMVKEIDQYVRAV